MILLALPPRMKFSIVPLVLLASVVALGCGDGGPKLEKGVVVTGKVLKGGGPIPGMRPEIGLGMVQITLIPTAGGPNAESGIALLKADGSFEILGAGKGIPAGKYKVALMQRDQSPGQPGAIPDSFSEASTTFEVEIPASKVGSTHDLGAIDLDKPPA